MFFPLGDENPRRSTPVVTTLLIAANIAAFVLLQVPLGSVEGEEFVRRWGYDARTLVSPQIVTSMFLHGGWMHLIGNMWALWIVGDNVEDRFGRLGYLLLYLAAGSAAALAYGSLSVAKGPNPEMIERIGMPYPPAIGASGAIYGVIGMYIVLFPWARIRTIVLFQLIRMPALLCLGLMIAGDVFLTITSKGPASGGVATAAHAGGGLFGIVAALVLKGSIGGGGEGTAWEVQTGFAKSLRSGESAAVAESEPGAAAVPAEELAEAMDALVEAGRDEDAAQMYPHLLTAGGADTIRPETELAVAHVFFRQGPGQLAGTAFSRYYARDPSGPRAGDIALRLGDLYAKSLKDPDAAAPWYERAAQQHPEPAGREYARRELDRIRA